MDICGTHRMPCGIATPLSDADRTLNSRPSPGPIVFHASLLPTCTVAIKFGVEGMKGSNRGIRRGMVVGTLEKKPGVGATTTA